MVVNETDQSSDYLSCHTLLKRKCFFSFSKRDRKKDKIFHFTVYDILILIINGLSEKVINGRVSLITLEPPVRLPLVLKLK